jgi:hypothetical protein
MSALSHPPIPSPIATPTGDRAGLRLLERRPRADATGRAQPAASPAAPAAPAPALPAAPVRPGWLQRLALWVDRQPAHHRLGSWYPLA